MTESMEVKHVVDNQATLKAMTNMVNAFEKLQKEAGKATKASKQGAEAAKGSFEALDRELKENQRTLRQLVVGSREYTNQKSKVDGLRQKHAEVKREIMGSRDQMRQVGSATDGVIGRMGTLLGSVASVGAGIQAFKASVEAVEKAGDDKRRATIGFEEGLVEGSRNFTDKKDRERLKGVATGFADQGFMPGPTAATLGMLKSVGAPDLDTAAEFLRVAGASNPGNIEGAGALARAALVEAAATGNYNAEQVIGGIQSAQVASQSSNTTEFANAFSANNAALIQSGGFTPEQAREEASKFSVLEPRSLEVAATSEKAFISQIRNFKPEAKDGVTRADVAKFEQAGNVREQIEIVESSPALQQQFIGGLQETGRDAIVRRIAPGGADQVTFRRIERDVVAGEAAAQQLRELQAETRQIAPFMIEGSIADARAEVNRIRSADQAKFESAVRARSDAAHTAAADDSLGESMADGFGRNALWLNDAIGFEPGTALEAMASGQSQTDVRMRQMAFIARNDPQQEDRQHAREALEELRTLANRLGLEDQQALLGEILTELRNMNDQQRNAMPPPEEQPVPVTALNQ